MINSNESSREGLDLSRLIAEAEAKNRADAGGRPTYADRVELGYKAYEIGLWELGRDSHIGARYWLQTAVEFGIEDARPLLAICVNALAPATMDKAPPPSVATRDRTGRTVPAHATASTALGAFAEDLRARPIHERHAARMWFPRGPLATFRSAARLTILARDLSQALARARDIDRDLVIARDAAGDLARARDLACQLADAAGHARDRALTLKRALDRTRDGASDAAYARTAAPDIARVLGHIIERVLRPAITRNQVIDPALDRDLAYALELDFPAERTRDHLLVRELARARDGALARAFNRALEHSLDPARVRDLALASARSGDRGLDLDRALVREVDRDVALALARAIDQDRGLDPELFDADLIEAVESLEELIPSA